MSGNLCRCTGYVGIIDAIRSVIADRRARGISAIAGAGRSALGPVGSDHGSGADVQDAGVGVVATFGQQGRGARSQGRSPRTYPSILPRRRLSMRASSSTTRSTKCGASLRTCPRSQPAFPGRPLPVMPARASLQARCGSRSARSPRNLTARPRDRDPATHSGTIRGSGRDRRAARRRRGSSAIDWCRSPNSRPGRAQCRLSFDRDPRTIQPV